MAAAAGWRGAAGPGLKVDSRTVKPRPLRRLGVFCGGRAGRRPTYRRAAEDLGRQLACDGIGLVYGGGGAGLMGAVADAVLTAGGEATGVIPGELLARELGHSRLTHQHVVPSMHARKALMLELSDAFVALPGGYGTLDELFEAVTWAQLGIHAKPVGLLDVDGYFQPLLGFLRQAVAEGFIPDGSRSLLVVEETPEALLHALRTCALPELSPWRP